MDKSWIPYDRRSVEYIVGVNMFMEFALQNSDTSDIIRCPYTKCRNVAFNPSRTVKHHFFFKGFNESYTILTWHGENKPNMKISDISDQIDPPYMDFNQDEAIDIIHDAYKHCEDFQITLRR